MAGVACCCIRWCSERNLSSTILSLKVPDLFGCLQAYSQSPILLFVKSPPEVRALSSAGITPASSVVRPCPTPTSTAALRRRLRPLPSCRAGLPRLPTSPFQRAVPIIPADRDRCFCRLLPHPTRPSPLLRRVGIRIYAFETCSGFTRVTARWIAQPPEAAFVTRLRSSRLPG